MARGLYGCNEGNEQRNAADQFADVLAANEIAEGHWQRQMEDAARRGQLTAVAQLREEMLAEAIAWGCNRDKAQQRADSTLRRAMTKLRL